MADRERDEAFMRQALVAAAGVRGQTSPNPWVGAVVEPGGHIGATAPPGGPHAEIVALERAGAGARGATLYVTLEPCSHHGRTPPCAEAIVAAGITRVVVGIEDPDPHVAGSGIQHLREAGVEVEVGVLVHEVGDQLRPYLHHRRTGRPWVVLKMAMTLDGRSAAPDGSSKWITGPEARADAHRLRAESDAVMVGAGTVRADDPALTVRHAGGVNPARVVLGHAPADARVQPAEALSGDPAEVLDLLGTKGMIQVLVEGGATVAGELHRARLVDEYVIYVAPALLGGDDGRPLLGGPGVATMAEVWRGRLVGVDRLGDDVRIRVLAPESGGG